MKRHLSVTLLVGALALAASPVLGQSFADIQGKWTFSKKTDRFGDATQTVEFKDNGFTYRVTAKDGTTLLYAKGKAAVEKLGPFKIIKLTSIEGGDSEANTQAVDDDRTLVYTGEGEQLTLALNFDHSRDGEEAECNTYHKVNK